MSCNGRARAWGVTLVTAALVEEGFARVTALSAHWGSLTQVWRSPTPRHAVMSLTGRGSETRFEYVPIAHILTF